MLKLRKANKNIEIMDYQNLVRYYFILNFDKSEYSADTLALVEVFKNFNPKNIENWEGDNYLIEEGEISKKFMYNGWYKNSKTVNNEIINLFKKCYLF